MAVNCSLTGIFNDIHLRNVTPSGTLHYGHFIGLGATYSQNNSLWPSIIHNETSFRSLGFCASGSLSQCVSSLSGEIAPGSSSWRDNASYLSKDDPSLYAGVSSRYGRDTLNIWTHYVDPSPPDRTALSDFPVTLVSNYTSKMDPFFGPGGSFGLGIGSTVLDQLYEKQLISSRSYGLHIGTGFPRAGGTRNGSIVLGGYDSMRFTGQVHKYSQVQASAQNQFSPFQVKVAQISLDVAPGQSIDLVDGDPFDAYLTTIQYPVQFPRSVTQKLADKLSAKAALNDENTLRLPSGSNANLTITLDDGFSVSFDSRWLSNASNISPISAAPLTSSNLSFSNSTRDVPVMLGAAFLQELYLFVSYDSKPPTFSLAQVNREAKYTQQRPLCPGVEPLAATPPKISKFVQQGLIGAVIASVIGGIALICFVLFVLKFVVRKRSAKKFGDVESRSPKDGTKSRGQGETLQKMALTPKQPATYLSSTPRVKYSAATPRPEDADRSDSLSSSSTKVSHTKVTIGEDKDIEMTSYRKTTGLSKLDFGFKPASPAPATNPFLDPRDIHPAHRSSSVYSGDM